MAEDKTSTPLPDDGKPGFPARLFRRATHEQLAYLFVLALYVAGMLLTALVIVEALRWGLLARFGTFRMMGLVLSFASAGLVISRVAAGRYGNRIAAHYLPHRLPRALGVRRLMRGFDLASARELNAFVVLYKLRVYSTRTAHPEDVERDLPCVLEPLFTHDMYLPMMRAYLIRARRLWFDADEVDTLISAGKQRFDALADAAPPVGTPEAGGSPPDPAVP